MATQDQAMTSKEFSILTGIPVSTVTKLIRAGKINAEKHAGKWMIAPSQLNLRAVQEIAQRKPGAEKQAPTPAQKEAPAQARPEPGPTMPAVEARTFSVAEFTAMTYLTEYGVTEWLKKGLLKGRQDENGNWWVDAGNLDEPNIKRLVRDQT
ncbi:MAG: helix-turn-helix domain-containing protein [Desulfobacterales bacterium]|nr:MAG: helix-turn-helix domain-containing protein [Desulfobacterales bacterium]